MRSRDRRIPGLALIVALHVGCGSGRVENANSGLGLEAVFTTTGNAEAVAWITVDCGACAWDKTGSEAIVFAVSVDDRTPIHVPVMRGGQAEYGVMVGAVTSGPHTIKIEQDPNLTAASLRGQAVARLEVEIEQIAATDATYQAMSLAPFVYARPDTVGKFTDVPLLMWYEIEPTERGTAVSLLGDLHERRRRHARRSADGDVGPHHRHRISLQRRSRRERRHPQRRHAGARPRDSAVPGPA